MVKKLCEQVLSNEKLYRIWQSEVQLMKTRITEMRNQLVKAFEEEDLTSFAFINDQHGMFSYSGSEIHATSCGRSSEYTYLTR